MSTYAINTCRGITLRVLTGEWKMKTTTREILIFHMFLSNYCYNITTILNTDRNLIYSKNRKQNCKKRNRKISICIRFTLASAIWELESFNLERNEVVTHWTIQKPLRFNDYPSTVNLFCKLKWSNHWVGKSGERKHCNYILGKQTKY